MSDSNGNPVTRSELAAHIKGIDENFRTIKDDIAEIKDILSSRSRVWAGAVPLFLIALLSSGISVGVALFVR